LAEFIGRTSMRTIQNWESDVNRIPEHVIKILNQEIEKNTPNGVKSKVIISTNDINKRENKAVDRIYDIQTIPIYDSVATLGLVEVFNGSENGNVLDYLSIPNLPKSDGAIFMTGDSMYPILKSGDIVALKIIHKSDIIYGEMHYVEYYSNYGDIEFKAIKYIKKSELGQDYIKLVSQNHHHESKDILLSNVGTVALVNASVRYNRL
ncbi:MAG: S24 family peptidase, partial [Chryseobacterium sp.]|nr:S24 family peptidase [Chryseobacterium sp.]